MFQSDLTENTQHTKSSSKLKCEEVQNQGKNFETLAHNWVSKLKQDRKISCHERETLIFLKLPKMLLRAPAHLLLCPVQHAHGLQVKGVLIEPFLGHCSVVHGCGYVHTLGEKRAFVTTQQSTIITT